MKTKTHILVTMMVLIIGSCIPSNKKKQQIVQDDSFQKDTLMIFNNKILEIEKKVIDLTSPSDLFMIQDFVTIYDHPLQYKKDALKFISQSGTTGQQKTIAVYSMYSLSYQDYLDIIKILHSLFLKEEIKIDLLERAISYPFSEVHPITSNYEDEDVQKLLNKIKNTKGITDQFRSSIDNILVGKTQKALKRFKKGSGY